jgi:hypothetical protein
VVKQMAGVRLETGAIMARSPQRLGNIDCRLLDGVMLIFVSFSASVRYNSTT